MIIGAGMAGLAAARTLEQGGVRNFVVLEGSSRVGGRIKHSFMGGFPVEHGAVWVHGGEGNPMLDLARQYNVSVFYDDFEDYVCRGDGGKDVTEALDEAYERLEVALEMRGNKSEVGGRRGCVGAINVADYGTSYDAICWEYREHV